MSRLSPAHWRGRGPGRHPRRVASMDSLLMIDPVDSTACEQSDSVEMHENIMATRPLSDQNSNEGHSTTQPHGQGDELGEGDRLHSGAYSSKASQSTKEAGHSLLRDWAPEITALVTAFCCLAAIYIILAKFNDQQQPNWPYARTLNLSTLIALIATILRSMLEAVLASGIAQLKWHWFRSNLRPLDHVQTFEDASRGPWGSLVFVLSLARFNLATLGSIIMVLSVVVGTLTQQAIQTVPCQKFSPDGDASVPIAQTSLKGVETTAAGDYLLTKDLKASLIAGLAGMRQPSSIQPFCPSGNCAFQGSDGFSYSTLGLSSECIDLSPLITQSKVEIDAWVYKHDVEVSPAEITNYTLPNGLSLGYMLSPGAHSASGYSRWTTVLAQEELRLDESWLKNITLTQRQRDIVFGAWVDGILLFLPTINPCQDPSDYYNYLDQVEAFAMPPIKANSCPDLDLPGVDTLPGCFSVTAAACFFYASVQQYEGLVVNGVLQEKALGDSNPILGVHVDGAEYDACAFCTILDPCVVDRVVYTNTSANLSSVPGGTTIADNTTVPLRCLYGFNLSWYTALMVQRQLWKTIGRSDDENICVQTGNYTSMVCSGTWWLNGIFNGGNASIASIKEFMTRGFDSLSAQLRMIGTDWDGNPTNAPGTAYDTAVCVLFRWEWLLYPLALLVGASVLLLLLLASSSGMVGSRKEVIWKSSVLPFLFYGLEDQFRDQTLELAHQDELKGAAKTLRTRFGPRDDGWRFYK